MATFKLTDDHVREYHTQDMTVFRGIIPGSLVRDLRKASDDGLADLKERDPDAHRIGSIAGREDMDLQPFRDYSELPELNEAVLQLLTPDHTYGDLNRVGILFNTTSKPAVLAWHRDFVSTPERGRIILGMNHADPTFFAQINCALYADSCLWVVPGSANREDTPGEKEFIAKQNGSLTQVANPVEHELGALDYCRGMPAAEPLQLQTGDFAIYNPGIWHAGLYSSTARRATIFETAWTPRCKKWYADGCNFDELRELAVAAYGSRINKQD